MSKKGLVRGEWQQWVLQHIMRPYQTMLGFEKRFEEFDFNFYTHIDHFMRQNPEWTACVFDRIAQIYDHIDADFFPRHRIRNLIMQELQNRGVAIYDPDIDPYN